MIKIDSNKLGKKGMECLTKANLIHLQKLSLRKPSSNLGNCSLTNESIKTLAKGQ